MTQVPALMNKIKNKDTLRQKKPPNPAKRTNMYKYNVVCFLFTVFTAVECDIHVW